ncbi:MAG: endonuclease/exonuclease/phosphatase family protein [bacterium]|nr:endonuclease/exonuclease/phosphatase family protein [bacterium]
MLSSRSRLRALVSLRPQPLYILEAAFIGTFFIQALRFLIGMLYSRIASASQYPAVAPLLGSEPIPGLIDPQAVSGEITFLMYMIGLPLITLLIGRARWLLLIGAGMAAIGRYFMTANVATFSSTMGAALTVGGGLFYLALLVRHRPQTIPYFFMFSLAVDQLFRAAGNTLDPSWSASTIVFQTATSALTYGTLQVILSVVTIVLSLLTLFLQAQQRRRGDKTPPHYGLFTVWSGIGLGGLLYIELALLALPNSMIARAETSYRPYPVLVPLAIAATLLPLVPWVRVRAREFISLFDNTLRGWAWMLLVALLVVIGTRVGDLPGLGAFVAAQFAMNMMWWWLPRPQAQKELNFSALWLFVGVVVFALLIVGDIFTFEYAFVRDLAAPLTFLNNIVPPLLRGFRGMGLGVLLLAILLAALPMVQTRRRIPWPSGGAGQSFAALVLIGAMGLAGAFLARPPQVQGLTNPELVRLGSYNIHAGYSEFWNYDLEAIADVIAESGANVVLVQEIETGRLTSFGVDQVLWLARRLGMDARYYGTNESLQGLAVLSRIEIVFSTGYPLPSVGTQTGVQWVQVRPDDAPINIFNTWLGVLVDTGGSRTTAEQEAEQQEQLSEIFALLRTEFPGDQLGRTRTVIGGTFNNVPDSSLIQRLRASGLTDPFAGAPVDLSMTFVRTGQRARLDYLWLTTTLPLEGADVVPRAPSDHRLVVVEVRLREPSG